jgi:hypothetical protein
VHDPVISERKLNAEFNPYHELTQALPRFQKPLLLKPSTRNRTSSLFQSVLEAHNAIITHHPSTQLVCIKPQNALVRNWLTFSSACQGLRDFSIGTYITLFERTQSALESAIDFVNVYTSYYWTQLAISPSFEPTICSVTQIFRVKPHVWQNPALSTFWTSRSCWTMSQPSKSVAQMSRRNHSRHHRGRANSCNGSVRSENAKSDHMANNQFHKHSDKTARRVFEMAIPIQQRKTSMTLPSRWAAKPFQECIRQSWRVKNGSAQQSLQGSKSPFLIHRL